MTGRRDHKPPMRDDSSGPGEGAAASQGDGDELLRLILDSATDYAIFTTDPTGAITSWPAGAQAVFGYAPDEIMGRSSALLFTPEDRARGDDRGELDRADRDGCSEDKRWHVRKGGGRVFMNGSLRPLRAEDGRLRGFLKIAREDTEQRRGEEVLRETERRLNAVLNNATVAVFLMDERQQCVYMNAAAEGLTGYTLAETQGRPLHDVIHHTRPDGRPYPLSECPIDQAFPEDNQEQGEDVFVHKDGSFYPVAFTASPVRDDAGAPIGTIVEVRGTAEEKAAEAALRESEEHYRSSVELNPQVAWTAAPDGQLDRVAHRWFEWTGTTGLGETWAGGLHPDDLQRTFDVWSRSVASGEPYDIEHRVRFRDGGYRWARSRAFPRRDDQGRIVKWYGTTEDIHEHKIAQEALVDSERRFRAMADDAPVMIWTTDASGCCTFLNARWYEQTGQSREEAEGFGWLDATHPDDKARAGELFRTANAERKNFYVEYRLRGADGRYRWTIDLATPRFDDAGNYLGFVGSVIDIDERKRAEEALSETTGRLRTLMDVVPAFIWFADADGVLTYYNDRWYGYTGLTEAESVGSGWVATLHPDDVERTGRIWAQARASGTHYEVEVRYRRRDGVYRWYVARAEPLRDGDAVVGWVGASTDIDDQKTAEARTRAILDSVPVGILMAEAPDGRIVQANRHLQTLLRRPVRIGGPDYEGREAYDAEGRRLSAADWPVTKVLSTGEGAEAEVRFRKGDDSLGWIRIQAAPVRGAAGEVVGAVAGVTDVQEIVEAREVLSRSREELEQAVAARTAERDRIWSTSQDLLAVAEAEGVLLNVNPAWERTLGWSASELLGRTAEWLYAPGDAERVRAELAQLPPGTTNFRFELQLRHVSGEFRTFEWTAAVESGFIYGVGRDVTAVREQAEALARTEEQLRQSQKMEAVGQLTGGIAHDFNNLLQIVVGNLELLGRNLPPDAARQRRNLDNAMAGAKRAATLTQRLLAFSRRQPLEPKPVLVNKLVSGMSELLGRSLGEIVQVETVLAGGLWRVEVDPNQLENAIVNLAVNARDAMPDGGKLTIETANTRLDESYAQQNVEVTPGQYVVICVSDTGTGMSKEDIARAFEPFFTTKAVGKGTGLGLSQVYGFVKQSGGHVKIYSETGGNGVHHRGTTVKIYLPRYLGPNEEGQDDPEAEDAPEGGPEETILVVEDDADVRTYTVEVLRELGYRVVEASDGAAAIKLLRDAETRCDLLFTDVVLPGGMNGEQLAAEAHEARPGLKVLFTTGYARNAIVHHGRLDPGVQLITKPFSYADLAARVRDVLDGSTLAPGAAR